ncbi:MAG: B12-binding domain-containing radical SAM protein [Alphaproteobacteria bacterium]|nr:B12-binding domain-containing radical SAM protein [Alphaproteobacteria bacterium]
MKVLFVVSNLFFSEPLGALQLSAVCKKRGDTVRLISLRQHSVNLVLREFEPDVVAYSATSPDEYLFQEADEIVMRWKEQTGKRVLRIMGGPHPTFFPEVLDKMSLDAICIGDGDFAIHHALNAFEAGKDLDGIPNIATPSHRNPSKEIVSDLDSLPFADRDVFYEAAPDLIKVGIRGFMSRRGCPHKCTYCFNHAYNRMFKGDGRKIMRRRSVDSFLEEIKCVVRDYPKVKFLRFADDVFAIFADEWLLEFAERYPKEVGIPFYCYVRPNNMSDDIARLLAKAGCLHVGMAVESGVEKIRNDVMKRNMSDDVLRRAFDQAHRHGILTSGNTIIATPGSTIEDDYNSFLFTRSLRLTFPSFGIFMPFPKTELTDYAISIGVLEPDFNYRNLRPSLPSAMNNYTDSDRRFQQNLVFLGAIFCFLPDFMLPILKLLLRTRLTFLFKPLGTAFTTWRMSKVFPNAYPTDPVVFFKSLVNAFRHFAATPTKQVNINRSA